MRYYNKLIIIENKKKGDAKMVCPKCNGQVPDETKYCWRCRIVIGDSNTPEKIIDDKTTPSLQNNSEYSIKEIDFKLMSIDTSLKTIKKCIVFFTVLTVLGMVISFIVGLSSAFS